MNNTDSILSLIPQRPPFVMVDSLLSATENVSRTQFTVKEDNVLVEAGQLTEAGLLENMAQTAAAGAGYVAAKNGSAVAVGYIGAVKNLEIFALPAVNDELTTEVTITDTIFNTTVVAGKVWRGTELIASAELKIFTNTGN